MDIKLDPHQTKAIKEMRNGTILTGGVGSGKTRTSIAYFFLREARGSIRINGEGDVKGFEDPRDVVVITSAKKRDDLDWSVEAARFGLSKDRENSFGNITFNVDSWNNILHYKDDKDKFFIFDEQRLVGKGAWVKAFLKIAKNNRWIMLSATPGDIWMDYVPVFIANGFFKNRTQFVNEHVVWAPYSKFPKVDRYVGQSKLMKLRKSILVEMPLHRHTKRHLKIVPVQHDKDLLKKVMEDRWHIYEERPIRQISELFMLMRRVVNSSEDRTDKIISLQAKHPRLIIFYNFNYELLMLRALGSDLGIPTAEWNGHKHQPVPETNQWLYLVQYTAGAEAWECTTTDAMVFYSLNYSYKVFEQSQGRIDRMNTPYTDLYYYIFRSKSWIDGAIWKSIQSKKSFNESAYSFELPKQ